MKYKSLDIKVRSAEYKIKGGCGKLGVVKKWCDIWTFWQISKWVGTYMSILELRDLAEFMETVRDNELRNSIIGK